MPANDRPWDKKSRNDDDDDDRPRRRNRDDDDDDAEEARERPRRRPREEDDDDDYEHDHPRGRQKPKPSNGLAVAGLILGILSPFTCGLASIPAIICSLLALGKPTGRGMAIAGLLLGGLGAIVGVVGGYFGFRGYEGARDRMKDQNNMKQIGLAFHSQHDSTGRMVAPFAQDTRVGINRELSFRVGLLPYIEQEHLYRQFDTAQAWDSPKNRPLSNTAISTYTSPYGAERASTQTPYRVFYGGGALFDEKGGPVRFAEVTDGLSNTIMFVHAAEQVPWAEPRELLYNPNGPLPQLWSKDMPGTHVVLADGSVRFVRKTVSERTLRSLITKSGGEFVGGDW